MQGQAIILDRLAHLSSVHGEKLGLAGQTNMRPAGY
jgi:hypothetical protein